MERSYHHKNHLSQHPTAKCTACASRFYTNTSASQLLPLRRATNLESALRHLRLEDLPRVLRVDAICINQIDSADEVRYLKSIVRTIKLGKKQGLRQLLARCHRRKATGERDAVFCSFVANRRHLSKRLEYRLQVIRTGCLSRSGCKHYSDRHSRHHLPSQFIWCFMPSTFFASSLW